MSSSWVSRLFLPLGHHESCYWLSLSTVAAELTVSRGHQSIYLGYWPPPSGLISSFHNVFHPPAVLASPVHLVILTHLSCVPWVISTRQKQPFAQHPFYPLASCPWQNKIKPACLHGHQERAAKKKCWGSDSLTCLVRDKAFKPWCQMWPLLFAIQAQSWQPYSWDILNDYQIQFCKS